MTADRPQNIRRNPSASSAAVQGAAFAFNKPILKPKPDGYTHNGSHLALTQADAASRLEAPHEDQRLVYQRSGSSTAGSYTPGHERRVLHYQQDQTKNLSYIAATLAASRSITPNYTGQKQWVSPSLRKRESYSGNSVRSVSSMGSLDQPLDTRSIQSTETMIRKFEQQLPSQVKKKRPTVQRAPTSTSNLHISTKPGDQKSATPAVRSSSPAASVTKRVKQKPEIRSPKPIPPATFTKPVPAAPKPAVTSKITPTKPIPIPGRQSVAKKQDVDDSDDSFKSVSSYTESEYRPSFRVELQNQKNRHAANHLSSNSASAAQVDALANAIVASSLASSRAPSPSKLHHPPLPPPRRSPKYLFHNDKEISRTPSPTKHVGLRTTMRKPREEEVDESEKRRGRKNLMKKHPNKHQEGDRKRWCDKVIERERKRYEAVWASNRGIFLEPMNADRVCNLVVRDIFSRSRLHTDVLEEVYELVDRKENGSLVREEFVVGLWLIDQRLKGRKLPIRVSESVWRSVGVLGAIKVRKVGR